MNEEIMVTPTLVNMDAIQNEPTMDLDHLVRLMEYRTQLIETTLQGMNTLHLNAMPEQIIKLKDESAQNQHVMAQIMVELQERALECKKRIMFTEDDNENGDGVNGN